MNPHTRTFVKEQDLMFAISYRMLGSLTESEDVVQDAWLRWRDTKSGAIDSPRAFLTTTVTRLCIDRLRKRKVEKLLYVGPWLPEPLVDENDSELPPDAMIEKAESISIAFLHLLESLAPLERAVFLLKETFDHSHEEIAGTLSIKPAYSRQLFRRAKSKLGDFTSAASPIPDEASKALFQSFMQAAMSGNADSLKKMLANDVIAYSDGGGRVSAALIPLLGTDKVTTVLLHLIRNQATELRFKWLNVNGDMGLVAFEGEGVHSVTSIEVRDGKIARLFTIRNPGKLHHIVR